MTGYYVRRDPACGYYGRQLWLPKAMVNTRAIKAGLEFPILGEQGLEYLQLWQEEGDHLVIPREFLLRNGEMPFSIKSLIPPFRPTKIISRVVLDAKNRERTTQRQAFEAMKLAGGGILNLSCGIGKTVLALHYAAWKGVPTLVIVNNTTLINQWAERISEMFEVEGGVGVIQGKAQNWDWEGRGIVVAMINTLSLYPEEVAERGLDRYFGLIIYDEVHHLSAPVFSVTAPMFLGERLGLTATVNREDGMEPVFLYHLGPVFYRDLSQELKPTFYIQQCPVTLDLTSYEVRRAISDKTGKPNLGKLRSYMGGNAEINRTLAKYLQAPLDKGRKVLALSHSVDQLQNLHQLFPESGLCIGEVKPAERIEVLRRCQLTFGTLSLVKEALDEATLDTLFFLTPFGDSSIERGGFNTLQQGMGRIQRVHPDKAPPVVVVIDYTLIPKLHRQTNKIKQLLRNWPEDQGGPLDYKLLAHRS